MSDINQAHAMLTLAAMDLKALRAMVDVETFTDPIFGFHTQQAIEKTLKAWLAALGKEYPLTHNLGVLMALLQDQGCDMEGFWELVEYTPFAVQFRYETFDICDEALERSSAIHKVQVLWDHVNHTIEALRGSV